MFYIVSSINTENNLLFFFTSNHEIINQYIINHDKIIYYTIMLILAKEVLTPREKAKFEFIGKPGTYNKKRVDMNKNMTSKKGIIASLS